MNSALSLVSPGLIDTNSLERIVPGDLADTGATGASTLQLHMERYDFASRHCLHGRVLDIACGVGYGTRRLADKSPSVLCAHGVDIAASAVTFAREHYADPRVSFFCSDANAYSSEAGYDAVVSLETIEHVPDPMRLFRHLVSLVKPGGRLIGSVPSTPSVDGNPHHVNDFTEGSFRKLGASCCLQELACFRQVQPFNPVAIAAGTEKRAGRSRGELAAFYARHPDKLGLRLWTTLRHGFANHYITVAWKKPS